MMHITNPEENTIFIYLDGIFFDEVVDLIIPCECE